MSDRTVVIAGLVLPGPTLAPPYATDDRCVLWVAAPDQGDDAAGGGLPFQLRADDGRELLIECAGASARLPVRLRINFDRLPPAFAHGFMTTVPPQNRTAERERHAVRGQRLVSWLSIGEHVRLRGLLYDRAAFRGLPTIQAIALHVEGEPSIRSPALEVAEPES
jgi:hypothetical protein